MQQKEKRFPNRILAWAAFILAATSLLAVAMPILGFLLLLTVIGAPLGMLYLILPTIAFVVVPAVIIYLVVPGQPGLRFTIALLVTPALLYLPPAILNPGIQSDAEELVSGDLNNIAERKAARSIAFRENMKFEPGVTRCNELCLHALLSGAAERVLVPLADKPAETLDLHEGVTEFSLQRQGDCPPKKFEKASMMLLPWEQQSISGRRIDAVDLMNLRISDGECLVEKQTELRAADRIVSWNALKTPGDIEKVGLDLFADMTSANRTSIHQPDGTALGVSEIYRKTDVAYRLFGTFLVPVYTFDGPWINVAFRWLRYMRTAESKVVDASDRKAFLAEVAGLNLELNNGSTQRFLEKVDLATIGGRQLSASEWQIIVAYYNHIDWSEHDQLTKRDLKLILKLLENRALPTLPQLGYAIRYAEQYEPQELTKVAALLFERLQLGRTWPDEIQYSAQESLIDLTGGINSLPTDLVIPHFEALVDKVKTEATQPVDSRLADDVYRDGVAPLMLFVMERSLNGGKEMLKDSQVQHAYVTALRGLCYAGDKASTTLLELQWWIRQNRLPLENPDRTLVVRTLARLGAQPKDIWQIYAASTQGATQDMLDKEVSHARADSRSCQ